MKERISGEMVETTLTEWWPIDSTRKQQHGSAEKAYCWTWSYLVFYAQSTIMVLKATAGKGINNDTSADCITVWCSYSLTDNRIDLRTKALTNLPKPDRAQGKAKVGPPNNVLFYIFKQRGDIRGPTKMHLLRPSCSLYFSYERKLDSSLRRWSTFHQSYVTAWFTVAMGTVAMWCHRPANDHTM